MSHDKYCTTEQPKPEKPLHSARRLTAASMEGSTTNVDTLCHLL